MTFHVLMKRLSYTKRIGCDSMKRKDLIKKMTETDSVYIRPETLPKKIKNANREIYNKISLYEYNKNESIFNEKRKQSCRAILKKISKESGGERYLDIGTGTGNMLRIAQECFQTCFGVDIGEKLLIKTRNEFLNCFLVASDAEDLPFRDESFNCVSCYALLHHLYEHSVIFSECFRILKKGGTLYTDHDPNYFFSRFYHFFYYDIFFQNRHGFGSETGDLAEYHNALSPGINPEKLRELLLQIGFSSVRIEYRFTDKENWSFIRGTAVNFLRWLSEVIPIRSLKSHFSIIAVK